MDLKTSNFDSWLAGAKEQPGSWWSNWDEWLSALSGSQIAARTPGDAKLKPLDDAPGTYVKVKAL